MTDSDTVQFGRLRSFLWPIHASELKMFLPLIAMLFLVCFNYSVLRNMKDSLVITASGAEVIPFIKLWAILPAAIISTFIFTRLSNIFSQERVFYIVISVFLVGYLLFAFVLYPLRDTLHPTDLELSLQHLLPKGFKGLISMFGHWTFTGFYVLCELWSTMVMSVLFWGFANEITKIQVARRFYSVLAVFSNLAAIVAGAASNFLSNNGQYNKSLPYGSSSWEQTMMTLVLIVVASGFGIMIIFYWMNRRVLNDPQFDELHENKKQLKAKGKLSMRDSISHLSNSKHLICIAIIVIAYNLTINLAEVVWKDRLSVLYSNPGDCNSFLNSLTMWTGIVSSFIAVFMAKIIGRFGWRYTALITPFIMMVTSLGFFTFIIFQDALSLVAFSFIGYGPLTIAVYMGASQNCLSKAMKYSAFDATKEIAFIPLTHECKLKGKAAIDGVGSRLGKSGGSLLQQGMLLAFGGIIASTPYICLIIMGAIGCWFTAVGTLGRLLAEKLGSKTDPLVVDELTPTTAQDEPASQTV